MYDMYPWDSAGQGDYPPPPLRSVRNPARRAPEPRDGSAPDGSASNGRAPDGRALNGHARDITPAQAIQIALDRRDNGGDAATPPAARPAIQGATRPAASQARQ
jgi:hypothetical protein